MRTHLVVTHYKKGQPMNHYFDDKRTAIAFRKSVNTDPAVKKTSFTKAIYRGTSKTWRKRQSHRLIKGY